ncbi:MAG: hypothetical protein A2381_03290 [Bdellovibrionales bacterium RIFOXYB1_FULL_37_110]|nr:MAG: hypothetical protein A2181_00395 [Bdellovibrionales bacterium RIFOXYA1_FULL_38_20]OFZ48429.1 MAG: hypothetical protein A2417_03780 [Bdellovibrionales bacterium RIFOXYC1_FULL_37_79]OFZ55430.1 MAG: hypothetical protein A2328_11555 [Bdellovibrionales bacterium RIFOXYB2_FULL_36_6]OFZ57950.1 MAG: hypothetical protein A2381_03290 [Bdellovibrionales bacterium RIFOXYB1_FULL_37_110]OFZ63087.1 MAG: hypothetical protein A2577_15420 [Bdellovibrionales bacterium RIFOXYD1_FULL_36_51]
MNGQETLVLKIDQESRDNFKRFDHYLVSKLTGYSRTVIKELFNNGMIYIVEGNFNQSLELKKMPSVDTVIEVDIPEPIPTDAKPENIPLDILYEDEHLIIVNKPAGLVTHPAPGNYTGTLVNAVLHHCPDLQKIGNQIRPGIVHRLDKGTSGVMVVAKSMKCHEGLISLFSAHNIDRIYEALILKASIPPGGTLRSTIGRHRTNRLKMATNVAGGRDAITHYKVKKELGKIMHLEVRLETGRTHQIRVHLATLLKTPVLMDALYGNPHNQLAHLNNDLKNILASYPHPLLHARALGFIHPISKEKIYYEVDPPSIWKQVFACNK